MNNLIKFRFLGILMFLAMIAGFSLAVMLLWNALVPEIFGLHAISYWQAAGLLVLARILFGGLGPGPWEAMSNRRHVDFRHGNPFREKWMKMSEDERKDFARYSHHHAFFGGNPERWMNMSDDERRNFMRPFFGENDNTNNKNNAPNGAGGKNE